MKKFIILDIDNTIANDAWRIPKINWSIENPAARYHDYHSLSAWDEPGNTELFIGSQHNIAVFTARPVAYRATTEEWLKRAGVEYNILIMRGEDDHRHSRDLKRHQLHSLLAHFDTGYGMIEAAYDDREDVIEMYRKFGINAHVRPIHNVCAYTRP